MLWTAPPLAREWHGGGVPFFFSKFVQRMSLFVALLGPQVRSELSPQSVE